MRAKLSAIVLIAVLTAGLANFVQPAFSEAEKGLSLETPFAPIDQLDKMVELMTPYLSSVSSRIIINKGELLNKEELQELSQSPSTQAAGGGGALVPFRSPAARFSRNILVTKDTPGKIPIQTEPSLAINPNDPDHLIIAEIDYNLPNIGIYLSYDAGQTWQGPFQPRYIQGHLGTIGDPVVGFDRKGNAYSSFLSYDIKEISLFGFVYEILIDSVAVSQSKDGGRSWLDATAAASGDARIAVERFKWLDTQGIYCEADIPVVYISFLDKPWMTIGPYSRVLERDAIYVTYTEFTYKIRAVPFSCKEGSGLEKLYYWSYPELITTIKMVKSIDEGKSWSLPFTISRSAVHQLGWGGAKSVVQGSNIAVSENGTLYIAWLDSLADDSFEGLAEIKVARSDDGGDSFTITSTETFLEPFYKARTTNFRSWSSAFPQIAAFEDNVYIVFVARSAVRADDGDVFFVRSLDRGGNWTKAIRINDDETNRFQFFPAIDVDPKGKIHIMWGDFRDDPLEVKYNIYYTISEDNGQSFGFESKGIKLGAARVSDFPSNPNNAFPGGRFIGDYFSIKATEDDVYLVWTDSRLGEYGGINQKIAFARTKSMPSPSIFISPPRGSAGERVIIQGHNFQPEETIYVVVAGALVSSGMRVGPEGRFVTSVFMPETTEGSVSVIAYDSTGNFAETSFYVDYGPDTVKEEISAIREEIKAQNQIGLEQKESIDGLAESLTKQNEELSAALSESKAKLEKSDAKIESLTIKINELEQNLSSTTNLVLLMIGFGAVALGVLVVVCDRD